MSTLKSISMGIALISLMTACSKSSEITAAPQSQDETGIIIQGSDQDVNTVLEQSSEHRVLSASHGLYEVKGLSLAKIKALSPQLKAEKNKYLDKIVSSKRKNSLIETQYANLAFDEETPDVVVEPPTQQLPPALQGCDMSIEEKPEPKLSLTTEILSKSLTMNLTESPGFSGEESVPHPSNPQSKLEISWDILAPGLSSIVSEKRSGKEFTFTPDSVGMYSIVIVAKDDKNACDFFVGRFFVTHNPEVQFAKADDEKPSIDISLFKHLAKVKAEESWKKATGKGVVVAVLDTGLNYNHPAIKFNLALNSKEMSGASDTDDDNNNFKDDITGWDFVNGDNKPFDDEGHGSHVSGLSSSHLIGLAKDSKVMPVKVLNAGGGGDVASIIAGIYYAVDNGAQVINASLGSDLPEFETLIDAVKHAHSKGVVFVVAAGNETFNLNEPGVDVWPAELDVANIITVGATGVDDALTSYSNFGKNQVDVAAPGGDGAEPIYSLATLNTHDAQFVASGGTSMASPIVAGIVAQILEVNPSLSPEEIKKVLMESGQDIPALKAVVGSGKLLNSSEAIDKVL